MRPSIKRLSLGYDIETECHIYQSTLICVDVVTKNCFEVLNVSWEEKERFTVA